MLPENLGSTPGSANLYDLEQSKWPQHLPHPHSSALSPVTSHCLRVGVQPTHSPSDFVLLPGDGLKTVTQ